MHMRADTPARARLPGAASTQCSPCTSSVSGWLFMQLGTNLADMDLADSAGLCKSRVIGRQHVGNASHFALARPPKLQRCTPVCRHGGALLGQQQRGSLLCIALRVCMLLQQAAH